MKRLSILLSFGIMGCAYHLPDDMNTQIQENTSKYSLEKYPQLSAKDSPSQTQTPSNHGVYYQQMRASMHKKRCSTPSK